MIRTFTYFSNRALSDVLSFCSSARRRRNEKRTNKKPRPPPNEKSKHHHRPENRRRGRHRRAHHHQRAQRQEHLGRPPSAPNTLEHHFLRISKIDFRLNGGRKSSQNVAVLTKKRSTSFASHCYHHTNLLSLSLSLSFPP